MNQVDSNCSLTCVAPCDIPDPPTLRMAGEAYEQVLRDLTRRPAEAGAILLGPIGSSDITDVYFDTTASCTSATYSPDHLMLTRLLKERWMPSGIDFKGFAHSHPNGHDRLSEGDMHYIRRLLAANDDMEQFAAPIVLPCQFRLCPFVVTRSNPNQYQLAELVLFC